MSENHNSTIEQRAWAIVAKYYDLLIKDGNTSAFNQLAADIAEELHKEHNKPCVHDLTKAYLDSALGHWD